MLVDAYNKESEKRAAAGKPVGLGTEAPHAQAGARRRRRRPRAATYIGTAACGGCHAPALAFWKTTKHARALSALERIGRDKDPSCVGCHVTGYLQPGGPTDVAEARAALRQCRVRGLPRRRAASMARPLDKRGTLARAVPEATCRGCHTADVTDGEFDYKKFVQAIVGPGHTLAPGPAPPL